MVLIIMFRCPSDRWRCHRGLSEQLLFLVSLPATQASQVAQTVKNLPAKKETWVRSLVRKIPWRRKWQSTPVSLPRELHGQRRVAGYSPWGHKESNATEHACSLPPIRPPFCTLPHTSVNYSGDHGKLTTISLPNWDDSQLCSLATKRQLHC